MMKSIDYLQTQRNLIQKDTEVQTKKVNQAKEMAHHAQIESEEAAKRLVVEKKKIANLQDKIRKLNLAITKVNDEKDCLISENVVAINTIKHLSREIKVNSSDKDRFYENARASLKHKKYAFTNGKDVDDTAND